MEAHSEPTADIFADPKTGISLFVLGFAVGPLLWAPMSELYGRQVLFIGTYGMLTLWNAAATGAHNIEVSFVSVSCYA